ncbi:hypothetical protein BDV95DRAFT_170508 [Massariosphaeria phaeospora]|uniref:Uncharacterized protein n=1 Tax=Massariosphaeria phaeospora TaxID=100035 RepID=A0A7C8I0P8_9PLEO|nr:hypothetical protein BDV95DRAFT_170508 [Massariosphaeria phaeospora]
MAMGRYMFTCTSYTTLSAYMVPMLRPLNQCLSSPCTRPDSLSSPDPTPQLSRHVHAIDPSPLYRTCARRSGSPAGPCCCCLRRLHRAGNRPRFPSSRSNVRLMRYYITAVMCRAEGSVFCLKCSGRRQGMQRH